MPAKYFVPFNHMPVNSGQSNTTYTVPIGYYARVSVSVIVNAFALATNTAITASGFSYAANSDTSNQSFEFWIEPGMEIAFSTSHASGTASVTSGGSGNYLDASSGSSSVFVTIDGDIVGTVTATASASFAGTYASPATDNYASFSGSSSCVFYYEEYPMVQ